MKIANYIAILATHIMHSHFGYRFNHQVIDNESLVLLDLRDRKLELDQLKDIVLLHQY